MGKKCEIWGDEEVSKLIAVWSDDEIQKQMDIAYWDCTLPASAVTLGFDHSVKRACGTLGNKDLSGNTRAGFRRDSVKLH